MCSSDLFAGDPESAGCLMLDTTAIRFSQFGRTLDIDTPFLRVKAKSMKSPLLAEPFSFIDELVAAVVSSSRIAFGIFVCEELGISAFTTSVLLSYSASHFPMHLVQLGR